MIDLNNLEEIKRLDPKNVYDSTEMLADQCEQIWNDSKSLNFPAEYKNVQNIIVCGMGGSAYGGHVAPSLFKNELNVPLVINNDYDLPKFANKNSLIILTSYSGSTEESLSCAQQALKLGAKVTGLTSGGKLKEILNGKPALVFDPKFNPSGQPRLGTGYIVLGTLSILNTLRFINLPDEEVKSSIELLKSHQDKIKKSAQDLARNLMNKIPVIFSGGFFEGNAHIIRNQFNETSKNFSAFSVLPELNHHLMEGLQNPKNHKLSVLFIDSNLYPKIIQKRIKLTKEVVSKNDVPYFEYEAMGDSKLSQSLNVLSFGGYLTLYLALLYGLDPSLIPWVDFFKENLHKN